ncbi:MAG: hypothetical protein IPK79_04520 [Vampirovibrionales bacterium]|nr:hypothetical protein [Vampirovibrionales bacterium]
MTSPAADSAAALREGELMAEGLLILGAHAGSGKTVAAAGLTAALYASGAQAMAFKPVMLAHTPGGGDSAMASVDVPHLTRARSSDASCASRSLTPSPLITSPWAASRAGDQAFLSRAIDPALAQALPEPMVADPANDISASDWEALLRRCRRLPAPCLFEAAGGVGAPWGWRREEASQALTLVDAMVFARALGLPLLLTVSKSAQMVARLRLAMAFLAAHPLSVVGWLAVETVSPAAVEPMAAGAWERDCQWVSQTLIGAPFLGVIPYSPAVSVRAASLGNLQRLTEDAIDLLPIRRILKATVT